MKKILSIILICIAITTFGNTHILLVGTGDLENIEVTRQFKEGLVSNVFHSESDITYLANPEKMELESYFISSLNSSSKDYSFIFIYSGSYQIDNEEITLLMNKGKIELNELINSIPEYARSENITIILCGENKGYYNNDYIENFSWENNVGLIIYETDNIKDKKYFYSSIMEGLYGKANTGGNYIELNELGEFIERTMPEVDYTGKSYTEDKKEPEIIRIYIYQTEGNKPPMFTSYIYPENGYKKASYKRQLLKWNCIDPEGDRMKYTIYLGKERNYLKKIAENIPMKECLLRGLESNTRYYWRVVAEDEKGKVTYSPIWTFKTKIDYTKFWIFMGILGIILIPLIIYIMNN